MEHEEYTRRDQPEPDRTVDRWRLVMLTIHSGTEVYLRWPYQAAVMKMFEIDNRTIGSTAAVSDGS